MSVSINITIGEGNRTLPLDDAVDTQSPHQGRLLRIIIWIDINGCCVEVLIFRRTTQEMILTPLPFAHPHQGVRRHLMDADEPQGQFRTLRTQPAPRLDAESHS